MRSGVEKRLKFLIGRVGVEFSWFHINPPFGGRQIHPSEYTKDTTQYVVEDGPGIGSGTMSLTQKIKTRLT